MSKCSNWFLTVNTNIAVDSLDDEFSLEFIDFTDDFMRNLPRFISTNEGYPTNDRRKLRIKKVVEVGHSKHRLHLHANIQLDHSSRVKLDVKSIAAHFNEELGLEGVHVDYKLYKRDSETNSSRIEKYMEKDLKL